MPRRLCVQVGDDLLHVPLPLLLLLRLSVRPVPVGILRLLRRLRLRPLFSSRHKRCALVCPFVCLSPSTSLSVCVRDGRALGVIVYFSVVLVCCCACLLSRLAGTSPAGVANCLCRAGYAGSDCSLCNTPLYDQSVIPGRCCYAIGTAVRVLCKYRFTPPSPLLSSCCLLQGATYPCLCKPGFTGAQCDSCAAGYFSSTGTNPPPSCQPGNI